MKSLTRTSNSMTGTTWFLLGGCLPPPAPLPAPPRPKLILLLFIVCISIPLVLLGIPPGGMRLLLGPFSRTREFVREAPRVGTGRVNCG